MDPTDQRDFLTGDILGKGCLGDYPLWYIFLAAPALRSAAVNHYTTSESFFTKHHHALLPTAASSSALTKDAPSSNASPMSCARHKHHTNFSPARDFTPFAARQLSATEHRFMGTSHIRTWESGSTGASKPASLTHPIAGSLITDFRNNRVGSSDGASPVHLPPHLTAVPIRPAFYASGSRDLIKQKADALREEVTKVQRVPKPQRRGHLEITRPSTLRPLVDPQVESTAPLGGPAEHRKGVSSKRKREPAAMCAEGRPAIGSPGVSSINTPISPAGEVNGVFALEHQAITAMKDGLAGVAGSMPPASLRLLLKPAEIDFKRAAVIVVNDAEDLFETFGSQISSGPSLAQGNATASDASPSLVPPPSHGHLFPIPTTRYAEPSDALACLSLRESLFLSSIKARELRGGGLLHQLTSPSLPDQKRKEMLEEIITHDFEQQRENDTTTLSELTNFGESASVSGYPLLRGSTTLLALRQVLQRRLLNSNTDADGSSDSEGDSPLGEAIGPDGPLKVVLRWIWGALGSNDGASRNVGMGREVFVVFVSQLMACLHAQADSKSEMDGGPHSLLTHHDALVSAVCEQWYEWVDAESQGPVAGGPLNDCTAPSTSSGRITPIRVSVGSSVRVGRSTSAKSVSRGGSPAPFLISYSRFESYVTNTILLPWVRACGCGLPLPPPNDEGLVDGVSPIRHHADGASGRPSVSSSRDRDMAALLLLMFLSVGPTAEEPSPPGQHCDGLGGDIRHLRRLIAGASAPSFRAVTSPTSNSTNGLRVGSNAGDSPLGGAADAPRRPSAMSNKNRGGFQPVRPLSVVVSPVTDRMAAMPRKVSVSCLKELLMDPSLRPPAAVVAEEEMHRRERIEELASPYKPLSTLRRDPLSRTMPDAFNLERVLMSRLAKLIATDASEGSLTRIPHVEEAVDSQVAALSPSSLQYILQKIHQDYDRSQPTQTRVLFDHTAVPKSLGPSVRPPSPFQAARATDAVYQETVFLTHKRHQRDISATFNTLADRDKSAGGRGYRPAPAALENFARYLTTGVITEEYAVQLAQLHPHVIDTLKSVVFTDESQQKRHVSPTSAVNVMALCDVLSKPSLEVERPQHHELPTGRQSPSRQLRSFDWLRLLQKDPAVSIGTYVHASRSMYTRPPSSGSRMQSRPRTPAPVTASTLPTPPSSRPPSSTSIVFTDGRLPTYVPQFYSQASPSPHTSLFLPDGYTSASKPSLTSPSDSVRRKILTEQALRRASVGSLVGGRAIISAGGSHRKPAGEGEKAPDSPRGHGHSSKIQKNATNGVSGHGELVMAEGNAPHVSSLSSRPHSAPSIPAAHDHLSPVRVKDVDSMIARAERHNLGEEVDGASDMGCVQGTKPVASRFLHRPVSAKVREDDGRPLDLVAPLYGLPVSHAPFSQTVTLHSPRTAQ